MLRQVRTALVVLIVALATLTTQSSRASTIEKEWLIPPEGAVPGDAPKIDWPVKGRARIVVPGVGTMGHVRSGVASVPIASVTKVMTAYVILTDHPLLPGEDGPTITVTRAEADSYPKRKADGESLVRVRAGLELTEREALEALLIRSGNNMADILGRWDAGSPKRFIARMNSTAAGMGLTSTSFADTSGLSRRSRSSAIDLLDLALEAMRDEVFAEIVGTPSAKIPMNTLTTTNKLLGHDGVIGIKTGSTDAAGGCLLWAAQDEVDGETYTVYGVLLGAPGPKILTNALNASRKMVVSSRKALRRITLLERGTPVVSIGGEQYGVVRNVVVPGWSGMKYRFDLPAGTSQLSVRTSGDAIGVPLERLS